MIFSSLLAGFAVNLLVSLVIVRLIYYPANHNKDYVFTYLAFNTIIYFVMAFMTSAELSLGVGFGLFAIFSVLRYRTSTMSIREMTYLFVVIVLPVINAMLMKGSDFLLLTAVDGIVAGMLWEPASRGSISTKLHRISLASPQFLHQGMAYWIQGPDERMLVLELEGGQQCSVDIFWARRWWDCWCLSCW